MECVKCGSHKIMKNLFISDYGESFIENNLSMRIQKTERAFFNKHVKSDILADVCGSCGYMELKVKNPKELWEAYSKK